MPSACTVAVLGRLRVQVSKLPTTKSERVAVGLWEERVSGRKLEKQLPSPLDAFAHNEATFLLNALAYNIAHAARVQMETATDEGWTEECI